MDHMGYIIIALLAAHLANATSVYRAEGSGVTGYDDELFGHPLAEEEEPLLKATSPKISLSATTTGSSAPRNMDASSTSGVGGAGAVADATLLTTMVTEFLASTAQTPNKEDGTESAVTASEQPAAAAATPILGQSTPTAGPAFQSTASDEANKRRVVTYDQRQEGQYNVRADLENFMIVLIPPTSVSDSLLDLLRKQQQRQNTLSALKRSKLKHHHGASPASLEHGLGGSLSDKYPHSSVKIGQNAAAAAAATAAAVNYLSQQQLQQPQRPPQYGAPLMPPLHAMHSAFAEAADAATAATDKLGAPAEFIEGRTPYRVDISASDDEQSHLHLPERQQQLLAHGHTHHATSAAAADQTQHVVDVLPPPYTPLAYQHLMKPYLEAESTFPPSELKRSGGGGNFLETYSQMLNARLNGGNELNLKATKTHRGNSLSSGRHGGYYRMARSILGYDLFKGNQLDGSRNAVDANPSRYFYPLYRSDHSLGASQLYPPLDSPRSVSEAVSSAGEAHLDPINVDAAEEHEHDDEREGEELNDEPEQYPHIDDLPLTGYDYDEAMEMQAKKLLERCSPGQRRNSYGLCRKIEGY